VTDANGLAQTRAIFAEGFYGSNYQVVATTSDGASTTFQLKATGFDDRYLTSAFGAGAGGGPQVKAYNEPDLTIGAGPGGGPRVITQLSNNAKTPNLFPTDFFPYDATFRGGVNVG
jgi:hypothetical protein